jgi:nicotinate-nucleotide--dimethylbenzimidazole phosphoribosyltransferase
VERHKALLSDPLQVLRCLGGREIAAMAGAILGARMARVPVILDGFIACAAAAVLEKAAPGALDHCVAGHQSAEGAHARLLEKLGKEPLLSPAAGRRLRRGAGDRGRAGRGRLPFRDGHLCRGGCCGGVSPEAPRATAGANRLTKA